MEYYFGSDNTIAVNKYYYYYYYYYYKCERDKEEHQTLCLKTNKE
jgi:hypothetical protein